MDDEVDSLKDDDIQEVTLPSTTYKVINGRIVGMTDGLDAMKQAIVKILSTERFSYPIYTENYGNDLDDLIGKEYDYIKTDIKRVISEALLADDRIQSVSVDKVTKNGTTITVDGSATTIFGDINFRSEVENH